MSFYLITYGYSQIDEIYYGETPDEVVSNARGLVNKWPEYAIMSNDEVIELLDSDELEFDLVKIPMKLPKGECAPEYLIVLYNHFCSGQSPCPPKPAYSDFH